MLRRAVPALAVLLTVACATRPPADPDAHRPVAPAPTTLPAADESRPFGDAYPLVVDSPFHVALLHWLDSLAEVGGAGLTAGKTSPLHRGEFLTRYGRLDDRDTLLISRFAAARRAYAQRFRREDVNGLTRVFLDADDIDAAIRAAEPLVGERTAAEIGDALHHFEDRYREVWSDGERERRFRRELATHPLRDELGALLGRLAAFYGVDPAEPEPPRLIVVPTPAGRGTHAQAIDRHLLLEVRPLDGLLDQVGAIVHENAHYLFFRVDDDRRRAWERLAAGRGREGITAWRLLTEALPTALGQGVAERMFVPDAWSARDPWYHRDDVDRYAKALMPIVGEALARERPLDDTLIARMLDVWVEAGR